MREFADSCTAMCGGLNAALTEAVVTSHVQWGSAPNAALISSVYAVRRRTFAVNPGGQGCLGPHARLFSRPERKATRRRRRQSRSGMCFHCSANTSRQRLAARFVSHHVLSSRHYCYCHWQYRYAEAVGLTGTAEPSCSVHSGPAVVAPTTRSPRRCRVGPGLDHLAR